MEVLLLPTRLHWILDDGKDDPSDLCAHSPVRFEIDGVSLLDPTEGDFTVSAAAIYLLRTLYRDHTQKNRVGEHLFPCCGHAIYDSGDDEVLILGSPNGRDFTVVHEANFVRIRQQDGNSVPLSFEDWRRAVYRFSDEVQAFYNRSLTKTPSDIEEVSGFAKMMNEWDRLRS